MPAQILDGAAVAEDLRKKIKEEVAGLKAKGMTPGLATILVGSNAGSQVYVRNKIKACEAAGITSFHHPLPDTTPEEDVFKLIAKLNKDPKVNGILVQLPLPSAWSTSRVVMAVDPAKDVDGFHPMNVGKFMIQRNWEAVEASDALIPCTPYGVITLLKTAEIPIAGAYAVVIGRSNLVGKPVAALLAACDATVTLCHSQTKNLHELCAKADILVAAIGRPQYISGGMVKEGGVVIDVGMNRLANGKLCGDVDFEGAKERSAWITPVPGGVGPMTVTMLLANTLKAARSQHART